jgi:hypothetical protein
MKGLRQEYNQQVNIQDIVARIPSKMAWTYKQALEQTMPGVDLDGVYVQWVEALFQQISNQVDVDRAEDGLEGEDDEEDVPESPLFPPSPPGDAALSNDTLGEAGSSHLPLPANNSAPTTIYQLGGLTIPLNAAPALVDALTPSSATSSKSVPQIATLTQDASTPASAESQADELAQQDVEMGDSASPARLDRDTLTARLAANESFVQHEAALDQLLGKLHKRAKDGKHLNGGTVEVADVQKIISELRRGRAQQTNVKVRETLLKCINLLTVAIQCVSPAEEE